MRLRIFCSLCWSSSFVLIVQLPIKPLHTQANLEPPMQFVASKQALTVGPRAISLSRAHSLPPLPVIVAPLRGCSDAAAIFVGDSESGEDSAELILMRLYDLTAAEARLSLGLLEGKGLAWAARQNSISLNTARTHLRHVFQKTQTHRQAELVRMVLRSPAMLRFD